MNSSIASKSSVNNHKKISKTRSQPAMNMVNDNHQKSASKEEAKEDNGGFFIRSKGNGSKKGKTVPIAEISNDYSIELPYSPKTVKSSPLSENKFTRPVAPSKRKAVRVKSDSSSPVTIKPEPVKKVSNTNAVAPNNNHPTYPSYDVNNQTPPPPPPPDASA